MRKTICIICIFLVFAILVGCGNNSKNQCETRADEYAHFDHFMEYNDNDLVLRIEAFQYNATKVAFDEDHSLYSILTEISVSELSITDIPPQIYTLDYVRINKDHPHDNYALISGMTLEIFSNNIIAVTSVVESQLMVGVKTRYYSVSDDDYKRICDAVLEHLKSVD